MAEMTTQKLTEYLKYVSQLETSVYKQTEVRNRAKKALNKPIVRKATVTKPQKIDISQPIPVTIIDAFKNVLTNSLAVAAMIGAVCFVLLLLSFTISDEELKGIWITMFLIGVLTTWGIWVLKALPYYSKQKKEYSKKLRDYEFGLKQVQAKYKQDMQVYEANEKIATEKYNAAVQKAEKAFRDASVEVAKLDKPLTETQTLLNRIYAMDIIFPKYRNMIAMCTIYEYFASGRCTELTGPTGAYNLYESELRQNIIINQLELVNANLEQIRQNQYMLYQSIAETNRALNDISASVKGLLMVTSDIAVSSRITAFCSQVTAANATAQTAMHLWD
jgi:hypothetical protein